MSAQIRLTGLALAASLTLGACAAPQTAAPAATATPPPASPLPTDPPAATAARPAETARPEADTMTLMLTLSEGSSSQAQAAVAQILAAEDTRFVAVFLELMRASQIGLVQGAGYRAHIAALEQLSGQDFGEVWPAWIEWYGATDLEPPPGFTAWKGRLLSRIDPGFGDFLYDGAPERIRVEEIQWGGVLVDGIPALDNPAMIPAALAGYLLPDEPVFGLSFNGDSRAYPLRILDWHEMANDVVGGVPVSLAYCTLCGAGIAYDGRASDGQTYTFGSSGFLFRSNKLMYDRQTRTLWNQLTGEPVLGKLAATEVRLEVLPVVLTRWSDWLAQHPDTVVLDLNTGHSRPYTPGAAYGDYFASELTMFPVWQRSSLLPAKSRVYALQLDGLPKAYPLETLAAEQVVNDVVGQTPVVLVAGRGLVTVEGESRRIGPVTYEAGAEVRAYARGDETFGPGPETDTVLDANGGLWRVTEQALVGPDGQRAERLGGHLAYWFGWFAFFPNTLVYGMEAG